MSTQSQCPHTKPILFNNYPNEWLSIYKKAHFFDVDPVVTHCKTSVLPILWEQKTFADAPQLWELAQACGVHFGWTQPVHDFQGVFSMLTLVRSKGKVTPAELYEKTAQVLWLCHVMHAVVARKYANAPEIKAPSKLTARETEILKWSAMGKTASEIAAILCLSERTVGFHISSTFKKLGVHNKIQAVLRAAKAGLF